MTENNSARPLRAWAGAAPAPYDAERVERELEDFDAAVDKGGDEQLAALASDREVRHLLSSIFGNSPFLGRILRLHPDWLPRLLGRPPEAAFDDLLARTASAGELEKQEEVMAALRLAKAEAALLIAMADITGAWPLERVTDALTSFADRTVNACIGWLLRNAASRGQILQSTHDVSASGSGLVVLGMGKYGSRELNYSSDIDLVVFYEPGQLPLKEGLDDSGFFVRMTKDLVKMLQERTAEGYVFRTDLRLRPDPGGTPVAVSLPAAESYYESRGQNWERAAFIKARAVAGDLEAGARFLQMLVPYIWRRNLDFAAIDDIHSMKRQIHAVGGHGRIAVAGHNIKLGRGGIREIEFFVQTQQLIAGGRDYDLRGKQTCLMLDELAVKQWITPEAAEELKEAYRFLRTLEHRLQMIEDEQTHSLPLADADLDRVACFMGFADRESFAQALTTRLECVRDHYAKLFETAPPLGEEGGSLVFTGTEDDPETLETLRSLGFTRVSEMSEAIRAWHTGRFPATRATRSRELLTSLMPALLRSLSRTSNPDTAFDRFDRFLTGLPAGVQLFSMLYSNPHLLDLLAGICGTAPRLANYLSHNPRVLEAVVDPDFFKVLPDREVLHRSLRDELGHAADYQDILDFARVWAREYRFRLGVRVLSGSADAEEAGPAYAALASELVAALAPAAEARVAEKHGRIPDGRFAVVAMGKLGSEEMSAASDLDLIVIYDADAEAASDGDRPLYAAQYYARVCQQLINALTAPTAEGKLYEVDMRLRPSGNAGPIATSFPSFVSYQETEAWTWEHMALTRARVIAGPDDLKERLDKAIQQTLTRPRDRARIAADVVEMRARIAREHASTNAWEMKHVRGGLVDIEFICQYLQLIHGAAHPEILNTHTRTALARIAAANLLPPETADMLVRAIALNHNLTQVIRVCVEGVFNPAEASSGLKSLLARAGDAPDFPALEAELVENQRKVLEAFEAIIGKA
ncbi:bifunctional [glutamine synthetase] adenylyltransferase/[glutamine synthetase]-adenylyl-L-tyrosine phosphorylase [Parvibaculum sp.]|uniref:bifunctional [glutamine synthetase] adenylyltransferase/[glutamine synthetase]-adenylyl-L-tyrosine phosphorylase n=1 Tax=Parvibaculum sp. TaxID=2024848 RepID=UPI001B069D0D|nr:bifunctional [glutamine synthetase] adenylyltransferase/[glutamine synthetase]-adenylyl-L-tyrosine phosphorylase [Parvibaculum sp.]MBO6667184.1 bifunctional [glutamine synthetase] adenylyltransferase/[glutamine synthetase]-adenylyl-L-tyrosine phosphorylase [Parvibaculum sp.]MBO6690823.1 bifunctional [glutamine synthetase] adenylyltransferase/[glutamine synthetase]-adenylyl-L-tyrosine phosphorylase [Parvibaculum sp.]MBO6713737.1 bifunctional [glutamine synthetase] adenylyltransferase/[glutamin